MPSIAPDTDVLDAYASGASNGFVAPDHEIISGFSAPANDLTFGAPSTPDTALGADRRPVQDFSASTLTAGDWTRLLYNATPTTFEPSSGLPFGGLTTSPAVNPDLSRDSAMDDLMARAKLLDQLRDAWRQQFSDDPVAQEQIEREFSQRQDALNNEAEAKHIPFTTFKGNADQAASDERAAAMQAEDLYGVMPKRLAKIVAPVERGLVGLAGAYDDSDNLPLMAMSGALPEELQLALLRGMAIGGTAGGAVQAGKGILHDKPDEIADGTLNALMGLAGARIPLASRQAPSLNPIRPLLDPDPAVPLDGEIKVEVPGDVSATPEKPITTFIPSNEATIASVEGHPVAVPAI